jgi:hypothetical protein
MNDFFCRDDKDSMKNEERTESFAALLPEAGEALQ